MSDAPLSLVWRRLPFIAATALEVHEATLLRIVPHGEQQVTYYVVRMPLGWIVLCRQDKETPAQALLAERVSPYACHCRDCAMHAATVHAKTGQWPA